MGELLAAQQVRYAPHSVAAAACEDVRFIFYLFGGARRCIGKTFGMDVASEVSS
jgi:hypothetical protein